MQRVLTCIDAYRTGNYSVRLARHSSVLLVLLCPRLICESEGREHGRSIPFSDLAECPCLAALGGNPDIARTAPITDPEPGPLARCLIELDVVSKIHDWSLEIGKIESMICVGINNELDRRAVALLPRNSRIVLSG